MRPRYPDLRAAAAAIAAVLVVLASAPLAFAAEWHPVAAITGGFRFFEEDLDLQTHFAYGARVGLSDGSRATLYLDYLECRTWRKGTAADADILAMRALLRVDALRGSVRPYVIGGLGGMMLQFDDAPNAGVGAFTFGAGLEGRLGRTWSLFAEGTFDSYTDRRVQYSSGGIAIGRGLPGTFTIPVITGGLSARF